jgi:hypothetical protein
MSALSAEDAGADAPTTAASGFLKKPYQQACERLPHGPIIVDHKDE